MASGDDFLVPTATEMLANETWTAVNEIAQNQTEEAGEVVPCSSSLFFFIIYGPVYGAVCFLGIIGNFLSYAVLHKFSRSNVATLLLKALAVSDNLFLLTASVLNMYPGMIFHFGLIASIKPIFPYLQIYAWPFAHMAQMGTVWMMVIVAANRYIAVCKPLQAPTLCTKTRVKIQIFIMTVGIVLYNLPRFFEYRYIQYNVTMPDNSTVTEERNVGLVSQHLYNILYENVAYCLFLFLIPLLILLILNVHLVWELKSAQKSREALANSRTNSDENNITLVLVVIIIVFIVCQMPASINQVLFYIVDDVQKTTCSHYQKYYHACNLLITLNSSVNFIIYCVFRRQFQQDLWALLTCMSPTMHQRSKSTINRYPTGNSYRINSRRKNMLENVPLTSSTGSEVTEVTSLSNHHHSGTPPLVNNHNNKV